jgi:hypothetical protein
MPDRVRKFLDVMEEHATPEKTRFFFDRMRALALGELEVTKHTPDGAEYRTKLPPDAAFAKLYLDRVYGPVKERDLGPALAEALAGLPDDVLVVLRRAA